MKKNAVKENPVITALKKSTADGEIVWQPVEKYLEEKENQHIADFLIAHDPYANAETGCDFDSQWLKNTVVADMGELVITLCADPEGNVHFMKQSLVGDKNVRLSRPEFVDFSKMEFFGLLQAALEQIKAAEKVAEEAAEE